MPKQFDEVLSNTVCVLRKKREWSQQQLADVIGVSRQTIVAIEKGNYAPSIILAMKIAHAFDCCVEDIFSYE